VSLKPDTRPSAATDRAATRERSGPLRLDVAAAGLMVGGGLLFLLMAPVRTESYYIDWISGFFIGLLVGVSEAYLTVTYFRSRLSDATLTLRCSKGIPEGTQNAITLLAILLAGYAVLMVLFGPIWSFHKTVLFTFNTVCGTLWMMWVVYLGALVWWAVRWRRASGRVLRLRLV
jgi:hypothetical protein